MAERILREVRFAAEPLAYQQPSQGFQARLLLGSHALDPQHQVEDEVRPEHFPSFIQRRYAPFERTSQAERREYWNSQHVESNAQVDTWTNQLVNIFASHQEFFTTTEEGQRRTQFLAQIGIDATNFDSDSAQSIYQAFFGEGVDDSLKLYTNIVLSLHIDEGSGMIDQARLTDSLPEILWFANIFGENSSHIVTQLIEAETALQTDRDIFIERGNAEINNLSDYETNLLNFVMQHGYREEEASQDDNPNSVARAEDLEPQEVAERLIDYTTGRPTGEEVDMSRSFPAFVETVEQMIDDGDIVTEDNNPVVLLSDATVAMIDRVAQEANDRDRELGFAIMGVWLSRDDNKKHYLVAGYIVPAMDFATAQRTITDMTNPDIFLDNSAQLMTTTHLDQYLMEKTGHSNGDLLITAHVHQEQLGDHNHLQPSRTDYEQTERTARENGHPHSWAVVTKAGGQLGMQPYYTHITSDGRVRHTPVQTIGTESNILQMLEQGQRDAA